MNEERLKNIWNHLSEQQLTKSDFDTWKQNVATSDERQANIHKYLTDNNLTTSDLDSWKSNVGLKKKEEGMESSSADGSSASPKSLDDLTAQQERLKNMPSGARQDELVKPEGGSVQKPTSPPPIEEQMGTPGDFQMPTMASDATSTGPRPQIDSELSMMLDIAEKQGALEGVDDEASIKKYDATTERLAEQAKEVGDKAKAQLPPGTTEVDTKINPVANVLENDTEEIPMMDRRYDKKLDINEDGKINQDDVVAYDEKPEKEKIASADDVVQKPLEDKSTQTKNTDEMLIELQEYNNTEGRKKDKEYIQSIENKKKQDEEIKKKDVEFFTSIKNFDAEKLEEGKDRADYINKNYGSRGFIAIDNVVGNGVRIMDLNGNTIDVDFDDVADVNKAKSFMLKHASVDLRPKEDIAKSEQKAIDFFNERGLNYYAIEKANENMVEQRTIAELAENLMSNRTLQFTMSDAEKRKYPMLFERNNLGLLAAKPNSELEKALDVAEDKYDDFSDIVGLNVFDDEVQTAMEDFDVYIAKEKDKVSSNAAQLNATAKESYQSINDQALRYFNKPVNEIKPEDIKSDRDLAELNQIQDRIAGVEFIQEQAADAYLEAQTYYDVKFDKSLQGEFTENFEGFKEEWVSGWNRGEAGDVILKYTMGLGDETFESKQEMAKAISESLILADQKGTSRAMHRFAKARGFKDVMSLLGSDPLEFTTQLAASSMAQMMPYGWKLVTGGAATGAGVGAGYGALFGTAAGPAGTAAGALGGAVTGGIQGARLGFAATSFAMEYTNSVLEAARDFGYDPKKPEEMVKALDDARVWEQGAATGAARGIPIAIVDYLSAGLAGKVFGTATKAFSSPVKRVLAIGAEQVAFGPVAESLGETAAIASTRVLSDAGLDVVKKQEYDIKEIMAEGLGAMGNNSVNLAINLKKTMNRNAKLELAESLTDINNLMNETASTKKILSFADNMKKTGQIDGDTYQQIVENVNIKNQTDEYIANGNPDLLIKEEQTQEAVKAAEKQTTIAETELTQPKAIKAADQQAADQATDTETTTEVQAQEVDTQADGKQSIIDADITNQQQEITEKGVAPQKGIGDKVVQAVGSVVNNIKKGVNRKTVQRKKLVKDRIGQLIKAREVYSKNKEIFGSEISNINKEINSIVTTGKIPPKEQLINLPNTAQVYKVDGKSYNSKRFKQFLQSASKEKLNKSKIVVANPNQEIKTLIADKNNQIYNISPDAIQEQQTETGVLRPGEISQEAGQEAQVGLQELRQGQAEVQAAETQEVIGKNEASSITVSEDSNVMVSEFNQKKESLDAQLKNKEINQTQYDNRIKQLDTNLKRAQEVRQSNIDTQAAIKAESKALAQELGIGKKKPKKKAPAKKQKPKLQLERKSPVVEKLDKEKTSFRSRLASIGRKVTQAISPKTQENAIASIVERMKLAFPNIEVLKTQSEFDAAIEKENVVAKKNKDGLVILGIQDGNKIIINPAVTSINTPIHEFGHAWVTFMKELGGKEGQAILNKGLTLVKNTPYYNKALDLYGEVDADGNLINEDLVLEEALVDAIADKGETIANQSMKKRFQNWLKSMYKYLQGKTSAAFKKDKTSFEFGKSLEALSFEEIQEMALSDLLSGQALADVNALTEAFDKNTSTKKKFETIGGFGPQKIITLGRQLGFSEASIMDLIQDQNPSLSKEKILEMMTFDVENGNVSSFKNMTQTAAFGNVPGGINAGIQMLNDIKIAVENYATTGKKKSAAQVRKFAQNELKNHPTYNAISTDAQLQNQLQIDLDAMLNVSKVDSKINSQIERLKVQVEAMNQKTADLTSVKKRLISLIRQNIPDTEFTKAQLEKSLALVEDLDIQNFDAQLDKLQRFLNLKERQVKRGLLATALKRFQKLSKKIVSDSKKNKSRRIVDEDARSYYENMSEVLTLMLSNRKKSKKALELLKKTLFQLNEDQEITGPSLEVQKAQQKASQKNDNLTNKEKALLDKYEAYVTFENVNDMSVEETKVLLESLANEEQSLRNRLTNKLAIESEKRRQQQEQATKEIQEGFGDIVFDTNPDGSIRMEYETLNQAEKNKYKEAVVAEFDANNPDKVITVDGKNFKVKLVKKKKKVRVNGQLVDNFGYVVTMEKPQQLTNDQLAVKYESLSSRLSKVEGVGKKFGEAVKFMKDLGKNMRENPSRTLLQMAYNYSSNIATMMRYLDGKTKFFEQNIYRNLNRMFEGWKSGQQQQQDLMNSMANKIFGGNKGIKGIQQLEQIKKNHDIKVKPYRNKKGEIVKTTSFTGSQMMRIYALSKNKLQRQKMLENNTGEFKLTPESLKQIEGILGKEVTSFVDNVVNYLSTDYFNSINNVYKDVNNVGLNQIDNYFPTKTDMSNQKARELATFIDEGDYAGAFNAQYASALKQRSDARGQVELQHGFFNELDTHFESMEKFKNYAPGVKDINNILSTPAVDAALQMTGFKSNLKTLMNLAINPNSEQNMFKGNRLVDAFFRNFSLAVLGFRAIQVAKQASSFINAFADYRYNPEIKGVKGAALDTIMFMVDAADVLINIRKNIQLAREVSGTFRDRYDNADVYSLETGRGRMPSRSSMVGKGIERAGGYFTKLGDTLGVMGYMINYNRDIKNGMNPRQAVEKFNDYNETQQTRRPQDLNAMQASNNIIMRGMLMFGSTSILQLNKVLQVTNKIFSKRKGKPTTAEMRELALNIGVANALFYAMGSFMKFTTGDPEDKEEFISEMLMYMSGVNMLMTALPMLGDSIAVGSEIASGDYNPFRRKTPVSPFTQFLLDTYKGASKGDEREIIDAALGTFYGINTRPFVALYDLFKDDDFTASDIQDVFGISKSAQRHRFENTKMGRLREVDFDSYKEYKDYKESIQSEEDYIESQMLKQESKAIAKQETQQAVTDMRYK